MVFCGGLRQLREPRSYFPVGSKMSLPGGLDFWDLSQETSRHLLRRNDQVLDGGGFSVQNHRLGYGIGLVVTWASNVALFRREYGDEC